MKRIICAFNTGIGSANKVSGSSVTLNNDLPQNVEMDTNHIITKVVRNGRRYQNEYANIA